MSANNYKAFALLIKKANNVTHRPSSASADCLETPEFLGHLQVMGDVFANFRGAKRAASRPHCHFTNVVKLLQV
jgi:hypothetical protein